MVKVTSKSVTSRRMTEGSINAFLNGKKNKNWVISMIRISGIKKEPLKKLFTATYPEAKVIKDQTGKTFFAWELTLAAGESAEPIIIVTSYRWLFYIIAIMIVACVAYVGFKNPLIVRKQGITLGGKEGLGELKIMINIKNPSNHTIHDMTIFDKVPNLADLVHEFGMGTLSPVKILRSEKDGSTLLKWNIEKLDPYEDRIISYKIKPRLSIVGDFSLPRTTVNYKKNDKLIKVNSNVAVVSAGSEE